ncbi:helix-turn-helix transcriptional regulator [Actinocatenispora sera]|uniref:Transcriptional regulator n=1 Tax=Actinocatenispora sera TaxID=390989 RepID=A0A810L8P2_9ACTN|nr:helix-turn-helix domain-containing protein [Actinocatenispora sera]BCJ31607.1 transcriptional regulator [Actinocatenispora sera]
MNPVPAGRRLQVLQLLRDARTPLGIAEIAQRLGVHANTVRFHLETLVGNGQVERQTASHAGPGRPPQLFRAAPGMDPMGPRRYQVLAEVLVGDVAAHPDPAGHAAEAGRRWGRRQALAEPARPAGAGESVERMTRMLDELGFAPEPVDGADPPAIGLRHCPFLELAESRADVVCPIHLGLMQGAMESWGAPVTVERLDAFVEPGLCVAHLTAMGAS